MKRFSRTLWPCLALLTPLAFSGGPAAPGESALIENRLMVRTVDPSALSDFILAFEANNPEIDLTEDPLDSVPNRPIYLLEMLSEVPPIPDLLELQLETGYPDTLVWGELLYENEAPEGHTGSTWVDGPANASLYANQYAVDLLGIDTAASQSTGAGVAVAIIDTGIDATHPALQDRIRPGGYNFIADSTDTSDVGDEVDNDGDFQTDEMVGHGTFVAGLVARVAPDASLLPIVALDSDGVGDGWVLTRAMYYAIDQGVDVINLSLGSTYDSQAVEGAVDDARLVGIVTAAAAGNLNREEPEEYPAMKSEPFGVAATDEFDIKAGFSNYNDKLAISAPGTTFFLGGDPQQPDPARSIVSTVPVGLSSGGYGIWSGTSMSTPFVSGAAALIRAQNPSWPLNLNTAGTVESILGATAVQIDDLNPAYEGLLGAGRLDIAAAVAQGPAAPGPGDVNNDGVVDVSDLLAVITDWGPCPIPDVDNSYDPCTSDATADNMVGVADLVLVIVNWG